MNDLIGGDNLGFIRLADPKGVAVVAGVEYWVNIHRQGEVLKLEFVRKPQQKPKLSGNRRLALV